MKLSFSCTKEDIEWAGMTCPENDPCPIYLELSSIASANGKVFLTGNIHSAQSTLFSLLLASPDNGVTWQEARPRVRGELLDHIQFANLQTGWISGQQMIPVPTDPFLLITRNGGLTWTKSAILPEGSPGSVQRFLFDSSTTGTLALDSGFNTPDEPRYRRYATQDGGTHWTLTESSPTPLQSAPTPANDTIWRIHEAADGKSLDIQHLVTANEWSTSARFPLHAGDCREP